MKKNMLLVMLAASMLLTLVSACSEPNNDIDRTAIEQKWDKADFAGHWYYTNTVTKSAPNSPIFEGDGNFIVTERLTWEITENSLIGWRDYASVPGTEVDADKGGEDVFKGAPVAMFAITDHFDRVRNYDPITGEKTNVWTKNREKPWNERQFMIVDWSQNSAPSYSFRLNPAVYGQAFKARWIEENDPADPRRARWNMKDGSFEFTVSLEIPASVNSIVGSTGPSYAWDFNSTIVDVRHSFKKVEETTYIPLNMPDQLVLVDENGDDVIGADGYTKHVAINDRFGFFNTSQRQVWDKERGLTRFSKLNNALRHNIWEESKNSDGSVIPLKDRKAKPIVYYTNIRHPKQLLNAANRVVDEWNEVFKDMVFHAQKNKFSKVADVPDMVILKENSCNPANVAKVFDALPADIKTLVQEKAAAKLLNEETNFLNKDGDSYEAFDGSPADVIVRYEWANSEDNNAGFTVRQSLETQALSDLERICTALEYYTNPNIFEDADAAKRFEYQRVGDLRFNMFNAIVEKSNVGWLGVATLLGDPITGEMINAGANIGLAAIDRSSFTASEAVAAIRGEITLNDLFEGTDIQKYILEKSLASRKASKMMPSSSAKATMRKRIASLKSSNGENKELSADYANARLSRFKGTHIETLLTSDEELMAFGQLNPAEIAGLDGDIDEAILDKASMFRNRSKSQGFEAEIRNWDKMAEIGIDTAAFLDDFAYGAAVKYRDLDKRHRFEQIREDMYVSTMLHEVGHSLGLRHNFKGSTDALNYHPEFWKIEQLSPNLLTAQGQVADNADWLAKIEHCLKNQDELRIEMNDATIEIETQECLGQNQFMFSSIMEYNGHWSADFGGLGKYDSAAIKFGYAQMIEVLNNPTVERTEKEASKEIFYNDWRLIPQDIVKDYDALNDRSYVTFDWGFSSIDHVEPANTVPYRFCTDTYMTSQCNRWDYGPDTRTNAKYMDSTYYQRYFFTHFAHDKYWNFYAWNWYGRALGSDIRPMMDYTQKMQWFSYFASVDPEFTEDTYIYNDYLATTIRGLNQMSRVISHPASGFLTTVPKGYVEGIVNQDPETSADRNKSSDILAANWANMNRCEKQAVANVQETTNFFGETEFNFVSNKNGFSSATIPLGDGRPFAIGSVSTENEGWAVNYVGTFFTKTRAIQELAFPQAWFPRTEFLNDARTFNTGWYRLFPEQVSTLLSNLVTEKYAELGAVVDADGKTHLRDLLDPETMEAPDYTGYKKTIPSITSNHQYYAALFSMMWLSNNSDGAYDLDNSYHLAVEGAGDDFGAFEALPAEKIAEFTHPLTGLKMRAIISGKNPVAADLIKKANLLKKRYELLDQCVAFTEDSSTGVDPASTPYCRCIGDYDIGVVSNGVTNGFNKYQCFADGYHMLTPGVDEGCTAYDLAFRRDNAYENMNAMIDFINDLRYIHKVLN